MNQIDLEGRVAVVTGGAQGIGQAIGERLLKSGARVVIWDIDAALLDAAVATLSPLGAVSGHVLELTDDAAVAAATAAALDREGRIDILVNNAGITADRSVLKMSDDDWRRVIDVNLSGAFYLSQAALIHMLERGSGRIVMISSVIGEMGNIGQVNYASSKAGLFGLTKTLAREAAMQLQRAGKNEGIGVTVNTVTPGFIETEMLSSVPQKVLDGIRARVPLGRLGQPEEIARVVHFLAADASSYITGQVWGVNGGLDM